MWYTLDLLPTNADYTITMNKQNHAFSEVSSGLFCNCNQNNGTESYAANFYMVTCDNLQQRRIQYLFYDDVKDKQ